MWWLIKRSTEDWAAHGIPAELKKRGIFDPDATKLITIEIPQAMDNPLKVEDVVKLNGDVKRGSSLVMRCVMCHQINDQGVEFGPSLQGWGLSQPAEVIAQALIQPSKDIAHGFDGMEIVTKDGVKIHGLVLAEGEVLIVRSMGGQTQFVPANRIASRKKLDRSMMLSAAQLGLSAQDVADLVAYLRQAE
jgi:putative heme-binding domain-containing protein